MAKDFGETYKNPDDLNARQEYNCAAFFSYHLLEIIDRFNLYEYSNNYNGDPITLLHIQLSTLRSVFRLSSIELSGDDNFLILQNKLNILVANSRTVSFNTTNGDVKFYPSRLKKLLGDTEELFRQVIFLANEKGLILRTHPDARNIMGRFE